MSVITGQLMEIEQQCAGPPDSFQYCAASAVRGNLVHTCSKAYAFNFAASFIISFPMDVQSIGLMHHARNFTKMCRFLHSKAMPDVSGHFVTIYFPASFHSIWLMPHARYVLMYQRCFAVLENRNFTLHCCIDMDSVLTA